MLVKNINGTGKYPECKCGTWLNHWINCVNGTYPSYCVEKVYCENVDCHKVATDGAHVQKVGSVDRKWYIVPLCHSYNMQRGEVFEIDNDTILAPVADKTYCMFEV